MDQRPLISIIITTYNRASLLERCIQSALAQPYSPVEVIVVDDDSTDETKSIADKYAKHVRYIHKQHSGIAATRNVGCRAAKGKYIAFVDDDDLLHPARLTELALVLREYPEAVCAFCVGHIIDDQGRDTGVSYYPHMQEGGENCLLNDCYERMVPATITLTPLNTLFKRDAGESIEWFDERFIHGCEDVDFFMRLCHVGPMVYVPKALTYVHTLGGMSLTGDDLRMALSKVQLCEKHAQLNRALGRNDLVRLLQHRQYYFVKLVLLAPQNTCELQRQHGLSFKRILWRLGVRRALYLLYLQHVKPRRQHP